MDSQLVSTNKGLTESTAARNLSARLDCQGSIKAGKAPDGVLVAARGVARHRDLAIGNRPYEFLGPGDVEDLRRRRGRRRGGARDLAGATPNALKGHTEVELDVVELQVVELELVELELVELELVELELVELEELLDVLVLAASC